ncbi:MAG: peptidase U32 family protein [Bacillota bacterium]
MEKKDKLAIGLELLSPAKNFASGKLALDNGADAVYMGAPKFGARQAVGNSWEDIKRLADYAHFFGARVYVALNTIFFEEEMAAMQSALAEAGNAGIDALIIQDPGIFELKLPAIPIFLSTQANNIEADHISFWEGLGCSRVILGRELSLAEIKGIKNKTSINLESFVHGSLCASYSGRCYISQAMCGRSANRGACIQACRMQYSLEDGQGREIGKEKAWLCLKDLNLSKRLGELAAAGITSFKIEGRLKDEAYAANTAASYREELDKLISCSNGKYRRVSYGRITRSFMPNLEKSFNRGFTEYNLDARPRDWLAVSPASRGEYIGKVEGGNSRAWKISESTSLKPGDGLVFFRDGEMLGGAFVNRADRSSVAFNKEVELEPGDIVCRNEDPAYDRAASSEAQRELALALELSFSGAGLHIQADCENGCNFSWDLEIEGEVPKDPIKAADNVTKQFQKTGGTGFYISSLEINGEVPFLPLSKLNDLRRQLLDKARVEVVAAYKGLPMKSISNGSQPYPEKTVGFEHNVANPSTRAFYERHGCQVEEMAMEADHITEGRPLMVLKHCLRRETGHCLKDGGSASPLYLVREGRRYRLEFDCLHCQMKVFLD